jgi:hypothetical protein
MQFLSNSYFFYTKLFKSVHLSKSTLNDDTIVLIRYVNYLFVSNNIVSPMKKKTNHQWKEKIRNDISLYETRINTFIEDEFTFTITLFPALPT